MHFKYQNKWHFKRQKNSILNAKKWRLKCQNFYEMDPWQTKNYILLEGSKLCTPEQLIFWSGIQVNGPLGGIHK